MLMVTLYRPVGAGEMALIEANGMRAFPPRLPEQPIFYPVLTLEYARKIARDWNTKDERSGFVGYVLQFEGRVLQHLDRMDCIRSAIDYVDAIRIERAPFKFHLDVDCTGNSGTQSDPGVRNSQRDPSNRHPFDGRIVVVMLSCSE